MSDLDKIKATLADALNLECRAREIVGGPPYFAYVTSGPVSLEIDGDEAVIGWDGEDCGEEVRFPASLLLMSLADIEAWKKAESAKYEEQQRAQRAARDEQETEREMMILHHLMVKYNVKPGA